MFQNFEQNSQNLLFWKRQIPQLNKKISYVLQQIKKPLNYIFPADFDQRIKMCQISGNKWTKEKLQQYSDVIAYFIEGVSNVSLIMLSQKFARQLGQKVMFWIEVISDFAVCQKYDQELKIWHVNDSLKNTLHLPEEYFYKLRKFQRMARAHISLIKSFIKSIQQYEKILKLKESQKVEQEETQTIEKKQKQQKAQKNTPQKLFNLVKQAQQKYISHDKKFTQFIKNEYKQLKQIKILSQKVNLNYQNTQNPNNNNSKVSTNNLQNNSNNNSRSKNKFKSKNISILEQKFITQFITSDSTTNKHKPNKEKEEFLNKIKECNAFPPIHKNILNNQQIKKLNSTFATLGQSDQTIKTLKQQYLSKSRLKLQKPKKPHYINLQIQFSYFRFQNFYINDQEVFGCQKINFTKPYQKYQQLVSYDVDSEQEFDQFQAEDISILEQDDYSSIESLSDIDFIDNAQLEDFKCQVSFQPLFDQKRFTFNQNSQIIQIQNQNSVEKLNSCDFQQRFSMICLEQQLPIISASQSDKIQYFEVMTKIVHDHSWKQIIEKFQNYNNNSNSLQKQAQDESNRQRYTRKHLYDFMKNHAYKKSKKVDGKRINVFYVKQISQKNQYLNNQLKINENELNQTQYINILESDQETKVQDITRLSQNQSKTRRISQNSSVSRQSNFSKLFPSKQKSQKRQKNAKQQQEFHYKQSQRNRINNNIDSQQTRRSKRIQNLEKVDYSKYQKIQELEI